MGLHICPSHPSQQSYEASIRAALETKGENLREMIMLVYISRISRQKPSEFQPSNAQSTPLFSHRARSGSEYVASSAGYFFLCEEDDEVKILCVKWKNTNHLPDWSDFRWFWPGLSPQMWIQQELGTHPHVWQHNSIRGLVQTTLPPVEDLEECTENKAAMDTEFDSNDRLSRNGSVDQLVQVAVLGSSLQSNLTSK